MSLSPVNSHGSGYPLALIGATAATRYVGGTAAGAPSSGAFNVGDFVIAQDGTVFVCTVAGSPGTWTQVGGGGATAGASRVLGPFPFAFDDAGLENGIAFYTPTVGDILLDAWIEVDTAFDGTTPKADIGSFGGTTHGWWYNLDSDAVDLTLVDGASAGTGVVTNTSAGLGSLAAAVGNAFSAFGGAGRWQMRFSALNPIKIVVSQDGAAGGTAVGGTVGAGAVYLVVAAPSLT